MNLLKRIWTSYERLSPFAVRSESFASKDVQSGGEGVRRVQSFNSIIKGFEVLGSYGVEAENNFGSTRTGSSLRTKSLQPSNLSCFEDRMNYNVSPPLGHSCFELMSSCDETYSSLGGSFCADFEAGNIPKGSKLLIPNGSKRVEIGDIEGIVEFELEPSCTSLEVGNVFASASLSIPSSAEFAEFKTLYTEVGFPKEGNLKRLIVSEIDSDFVFTVPPSIEYFEIDWLSKNVNFAQNSQCRKLYISFITSDTTLTVPPLVEVIDMDDIAGRLQFHPDSKCETLDITTVLSNAEITYPSSIKDIKISTLKGQIIIPSDAQLESLEINGVSYTQAQIQELMEGAQTLPSVIIS